MNAFETSRIFNEFCHSTLIRKFLGVKSGSEDGRLTIWPIFFLLPWLKEWKNSPIRYSRSRLLNTHQSSNIKAGLKKQQPASAAEDRRAEIHYNILQRYKWCIIHGAMIHNKPIVRIDTRMICVDILEVVCAIKLYQIGGRAKKQLIKLHETCLFVGAEATTSKSLGLAAAKRVPWAQRRDFDCKRFACLTRPIENVDWFFIDMYSIFCWHKVMFYVLLQ